MEFDKWIDEKIPSRRYVGVIEEALRQAWEAGVKNERERESKKEQTLIAKIEKLQRGEFICHRCGLRKDSEHKPTCNF